MQLYDQFYRRFGIRTASRILNPPLPILDRLELPRGSIFHYVGDGDSDIGPASDEFLFRNIERPMLMSFVVENGDFKGNAVRIQIPTEPIIRGYFSKNRRYRPLRDMSTLNRDSTIQAICNYALINRLYRYPRSFYAKYYKWWNKQAAVWQNINHLGKTTSRQQFIDIKIPRILPGRAALEKAANTALNQQILKLFPEDDSLFLLEIWKWLGAQRKQSLLNYVEKDVLGRVNFIIREGNRWATVNLGLLDSWRAPTKEELEEIALKDPKLAEELRTKGLPAATIQKLFLRMCMYIYEARNKPPAEEEDIESEVNEADEDERYDAGQVQKANPPEITQKPVEVPKQNEEGVITNNPVDPTVNAGELVSATELPTPKALGEKDYSFLNEDVLKQIDDDMDRLDDLSKQAYLSVDGEGESTAFVEEEESDDLSEGVMAVCRRMANNNLMTANEYRRYEQMSQAYKSLSSPDGKETLEQFIDIPRELIEIKESPSIPDIPTVTDKTMLKSSLLAFDEQYIEKVLPRNVAAMVLNLQKAGIAITDYQVEREEDIMGAFDSYTVRVNPVDGTPSTLRFKLPVVDKNGYFQANGVKYRLRKQRGDLPIRKVGPGRVALTSYYGKTFVTRSSKRANNYGIWLRNIITAKGLDQADPVITNFSPANAFDNAFKCPRLFSTLAMGFRQLTLTPFETNHAFHLNFSSEKRAEIYGQDMLDTYEKDGFVILGKDDSGNALVVDEQDALYLGREGNLIDLGTIENLLGIDAAKAPIEYAELKIMGTPIPIGVILGYELGLDNLIKLLKIDGRIVQAGSRVGLQPHEFAIVFADETLVFSRDDRLAAMVLGGFNAYHKAIRQYNTFEFNKRGVYLNILETTGASHRYLREIDLMYQLFIDPITKELLEQMKEPTNFRGLLLRACEMMLDDQHPDELDSAFMRVKGYERMAGAAYSELVKAVRAHGGRTGKSNMPIDLHPYAVWQRISQDPAKVQAVETNPLQEMKEMSAMTYSGDGGRSSRSMTKHTRVYHPNDMGVVSEATVDSSDVAINTYTSADPQFNSVYGTAKPYVIGQTGATALMSATALISPAADQDDPKRVNFIGIQHSHGISCQGYTQSYVRTGYEQVIAHLTSDLFGQSARQSGTVLSVTATGIIVQYEDGEKQGIELGRRYGNAAGLIVPHSVVTTLKAGDKFDPGQILAYNDGFFEPDIMNPTNVVWKAGSLVKTALMESPITLEDSSQISRRVADKLSTKITKTRTIVLNFDQAVHRMVKPGSRVEAEDILCVIEDAITADTGMFDEESLDTLRVLSAQTPQAKAPGILERFEVYYHGEKEDMSDSLRMLANASDKQLAQRANSLGRKAFTGSVDDGFRVDGNPLMLDTLAIKFYITADVSAGVGDKGVFGNQLKTVFGKVSENEITTESGQVIDAIFGAKSVGDRIVHSPMIIGTTNMLLGELGRRVVKAYRS